MENPNLPGAFSPVKPTLALPLYPVVEKPPPGFLSIYGTKPPVENFPNRSSGSIDLPPIYRTASGRDPTSEVPAQNRAPSMAAGTVQCRKYRKAQSHHDYDFDGKHRMSRDQIRRKEDRREKNRLAAKNCREEKQNYIRSLEARVSMLEARNRELIEKLSGLKDIILELSKNRSPGIIEERFMAPLMADHDEDTKFMEGSLRIDSASFADEDEDESSSASA